MNMLSLQHFPIYSIMVLFLGAFLIVMFGRNKVVRHAIALLATFASFFFMAALFRPVMLEGETIAYWMGGRVPAGGYAIGIALEVDALSLFFGLLVSCVVFIACIYSKNFSAYQSII